MKLFVVFLFSFLCVLPHTLFAEGVNAGFVQGLWYSKEPVFDGVPTRIYVAMRNNTGHDLTSTVRFTDNGKRIGTFEVSALEGRLVEAWVDWTPTYGSHTITALVSDAELHIIGGDTEQIDITGITASDTLMVDYDTDSDGLGNDTDSDDDNDTISDDDERTRGTNSLVANPKTTSPNTEEPTVNKDPSREKLPETPLRTGKDESGLEQFIDEGVADTFLTRITQKIEDAENSLNTYRETRSTMLGESGDAVASSTDGDLDPQSTYIEHMTVTRSRTGDTGDFLSSFVAGLASLLSRLWTLVLFVISKILSHPAVLEAVFLLIILTVTYRVARRLGGRRRY